MRWALLAVLAVLPIQWVLVPVPVIGGQRLHIAALLLFTVAALVTYSRARFADVLTVSWPFVGGMSALSALWIATDQFHGDSPRDAVQQTLLLAICAAVGTGVLDAVRDPRSTRTLRWAAPACTMTLLAGLTVSMVLNSVNPAEVLTDAVASGDPDVLQRTLFKDALLGFGYDSDSLLSNVRHEILAAVLVAAYVSVIATRLEPFDSRAGAVLVRVALALSLVLVVLSLSRATMIAAAAWPALSLLRSWQRQHFNSAQVAVGLLVVCGAGAAALGGIVNLIWTRFTGDTTSYEAREGLLANAFANIRSHALTGGVSTRGESSHNVILDSWLRTGLGGAVAATVVTALLVGLLVTLIFRIGREPAWMVPVTAALALVVIRMFTAGGGTIPPVEWVAVGVVAGMMAHRRVIRESDSAPSPSGKHRGEIAGALV